MKGKAIHFLKLAAMSAMVAVAGNGHTATLDVSQTPLFLGSAVQPNVFFVNDDSGSMDWEFMTQKHWLARAYDPNPIRDGSFESFDYNNVYKTDGLFATDIGPWGVYTYIYYYQHGDDAYWNGCANSMERCDADGYTPSIFDIDWRSRSAGVNSIFYSTDAEYKPWQGPCDTGVPCEDASYSAAKSNPRIGEAGATIIRNLATDGDAQGGAFVYEVWIDDAGFTATDGRPHRGDNFNYVGIADATGIASPNGLVDLWDTHYRFTVEAGFVSIDKITYDPHTTSEGNRGLNETTVNLGVVATAGACYDILGTTASVALIGGATTPIISAVGGEGCRSIAEVQTNIANWYQYSRRRSFPVKGAISAVIDAQPNFRYGITLINESNKLFVEVPGSSVTNVSAHNIDLKERMYSHDQAALGTPLRIALRDAGKYYDDSLGKVDPIVYSCQKNFTVLLTDGYWNGNTPNVGNSDGDGASNRLADVAHHYYSKDLSSSMANNVLRDEMEGDLKDPANPLNPKTFQHMVTFTVAFGVAGTLVDADGDNVPDADYAGSNWSTVGKADKDGNWGPGSTDPDKIDDLWHAAYNSGGSFASASTPQEVTRKLIDAISNIAARISSAAAVALNSGTLNANSRVYQASFDSNDWSGTLKSIPIQDGPVDILPLGNPDGQDDSPPECDAHPTLGELCLDANGDGEWDAAEKLAARTAASRNIYTFNTSTYVGIEFNALADLSSAQQTALKTNPDDLSVQSDAIGQLRLDYIRGDDGNEGSATGEFRKRKVLSSGTSKLGDIIHSAPAFVANPNLFIPDNLESASYGAYKESQKNRKGIVYVGANDGMLHAFDASNAGSKGEELFAYVPGKLVSKLPQLTSQSYNISHTYYVDGSPMTFDAFDGSGWKTLVAVPAAAGAQLVFALDVTNPTTFTENNVLWEFTDEPRVTGGYTFGDVDLGYTIGDLNYARMNNGQWVVIFGNGFNNTEADGNASTTGNAAIYIVDAFTGALVKKLDTGAGMAEDPSGGNRPNGIASVTPVDLNGDLKVDYLYAGDLFGNVWKMNVTSATPASWDSAWASGGKPKPFFIAKDVNGDVQPITTKVAVKAHPVKVDESLVLFGTGSYFQLNDATITQTQSFYSVWDDNTAAQYGRASLLQQRILGVVLENGEEHRVSSSSDLNPGSYKIDWNNHKGWYMDLPESGERINVNPLLRGNRIIFVTLTPDSDPCNAGGTSWIMELRSDDGSRLIFAPFDVNGDGIIDENDFVTYGGADTITSGIRSKSGIVASPGILNTNGKEMKYFSGSSGNIETIDESAGEGNIHRQSWRQLR